MRIAVLSAGTGWHVADLRRAAARLGHDAVAIDFRKLGAGVGPESCTLHAFDAVLVRTMPPGSLEQVVFRMDLLHRLHARGLPVLNPPRAVEVCVDKYLSTALLEEAGLPVPPTVVCQTADDALQAFADLGSDVVVKPLFGSEGRGMVRVSNPELAWRTFHTLERTQSILYLQRFVPHPGWDLRLLVIAGRVPAAMRRHAAEGWRTNVAQGGRAEAVRPTPEEEALAVRAAAALGTPVAGVDLLRDDAGRWYVIEVNAVPGWRRLAAVTGVDVAGEVVRFVAEDYRPGR
jgi:RimK family alpha-L-glutamate ligase